LGLDYALWFVLFITKTGSEQLICLLDTIYACQDRKDDVKVGVKSTAVMLGDFVRPFTFSCAVLFVSTLVYAGILNEQTSYFFYVTIGGTSLHLIWQYITVDLDSPDSCGCKLSSHSAAPRI
jgi:4-hydroxybenzoate polyprenyltransferase